MFSDWGTSKSAPLAAEAASPVESNRSVSTFKIIQRLQIRLVNNDAARTNAGPGRTGLLFKPLLDLLPATIKPIVIAYPGDRSLNYDELLPIVLDALPRDEMFILLGESFSGPLAVMVAATSRPALSGWSSARPSFGLHGRMLSPLFTFLHARYRPAFLPFKRLRAWLGEYATAEYRALVSEMSKRLRPAVIAFRVRQVFDVDVTDAL